MKEKQVRRRDQQPETRKGKKSGVAQGCDITREKLCENFGDRGGIP